jgi:hypothetical protein
MTEDKKAQRWRRPRVRRAAFTRRLLAKDGEAGMGMPVAERAGKQALLVFSGEGEDGWCIRETTAAELISILYVPCADVGWVTVDPSPETTPETIHSDGVSRERLVSLVLNSPCSYPPQAGARRHTRGLVGPA